MPLQDFNHTHTLLQQDLHQHDQVEERVCDITRRKGKELLALTSGRERDDEVHRLAMQAPLIMCEFIQGATDARQSIGAALDVQMRNVLSNYPDVKARLNRELAAVRMLIDSRDALIARQQRLTQERAEVSKEARALKAIAATLHDNRGVVRDGTTLEVALARLMPSHLYLRNPTKDINQARMFSTSVTDGHRRMVQSVVLVVTDLVLSWGSDLSLTDLFMALGAFLLSEYIDVHIVDTFIVQPLTNNVPRCETIYKFSENGQTRIAAGETLSSKSFMTLIGSRMPTVQKLKLYRMNVSFLADDRGGFVSPLLNTGAFKARGYSIRLYDPSVTLLVEFRSDRHSVFVLANRGAGVLPGQAGSQISVTLAALAALERGAPAASPDNRASAKTPDPAALRLLHAPEFLEALDQVLPEYLLSDPDPELVDKVQREHFIDRTLLVAHMDQASAIPYIRRLSKLSATGRTTHSLTIVA